MKKTSRQPKSSPPNAIDQSADDRAERRAECDDGPDHAEGAAAVAPLEHLLDQPGHLGVDQPAGQSLQDARDDQDLRVRCQAGQGARDHEAGDARR